MDTTEHLTHRTTTTGNHSPPQDDTINNDTINNADAKTSQKHRRPSIPRRGIRSLAVGIAIPVALTLANISIFGWNRNYQLIKKPFWIPPLWALHLTCLSSAFVMGLAAWMVWAEGGFHRKPGAIGLYLGQLGLSMVWDPVFMKMGATRVGLVVCLGLVGVLVACARVFGSVNRTAGDLVKVCLVWAGFLTLVNLYFVV